MYVHAQRTLMALALVLLFIVSPFPLLWAQRPCCEGDTWLKWNKETRENYVSAYVLGRVAGYSDACYKAAKSWPSPITLGNETNPISRCFKQMPEFNEEPAHYAQQVTRLYQKYPKDRILLIREILEALGNGESVQQIHEHPPFPAKDVFKPSPSL